MSSTNKTATIELSQYIGTDKPTYLTDYNGDMLKIDNAIAADRDSISTVSGVADGANRKADANKDSIDTLNEQVNGDPEVPGDSGLAGTVRTNTSSITTINELLGNGTPTTTDHTVIGAINELHADQGDLANLETTAKTSLVAAINEVAQDGGSTPSAASVTYDNTTSGLTADDVQEAIDELAANEGDLTNLTTTAKSSLVAAINEVAQSGGPGYKAVKATVTFTNGMSEYSDAAITATSVVIAQRAKDPAGATVHPITAVKVENGKVTLMSDSTSFGGTEIVYIVIFN